MYYFYLLFLFGINKCCCCCCFVFVVVGHPWFAEGSINIAPFYLPPFRIEATSFPGPFPRLASKRLQAEKGPGNEVGIAVGNQETDLKINNERCTQCPKLGQEKFPRSSARQRLYVIASSLCNQICSALLKVLNDFKAYAKRCIQLYTQHQEMRKQLFTKDLGSGTVFLPLLPICQAFLPLRTKC